MKKFTTDERTGLTYELLGDYYLVTGMVRYRSNKQRI